MSGNLVPCPLGPNCASGTSIGHEPGSAELGVCEARAKGKTSTASVGLFDPSRAYSHTTDAMKRLHRRIKRAWGADGRGIPNLVGPPGIGKSEMVENIARQMGGDFMIFDVSSLDPDILNGIPYNPNDGPIEPGGTDGEGRIRIAGRLYEREIAEMFFRDPDRPLIVFLDEINGGKEALMSSLQKVMTARVLPQEGVRLNDNVFLVAAMNDAEHTSNGNDLAAAMVSRLTPIPVTPNFQEWVNGEMTFWGKGFDAERMSRVASALGEEPPTPEQYLEAATHVTQFLDEMGNADKSGAARDDSTLNIFSQPLDEEALTEKVGQPRSWSKAIGGIAMAIANREPGVDPGEETAEYAQIVRDNCGTRAARDFAAYHETHRDLPDVKEALAKGTFGGAEAEWKSRGRTDIPMYTMSVLASMNYNCDIPRMSKAMDLMGELANQYPDMTAGRLVAVVDSWSNEVRENHGSGEKFTEFSTMMLNKIKSNKAIDTALGNHSASGFVVSGARSVAESAVTAAKESAQARNRA